MNDAPHFCLDILVCINHQQLFNKEMSSKDILKINEVKKTSNHCL